MYHEEISRVRVFWIFFGFLFAGGQARQCKAKRVQMGDRQASVYIFFALSFFFFIMFLLLVSTLIDLRLP